MSLIHLSHLASFFFFNKKEIKLIKSIHPNRISYHPQFKSPNFWRNLYHIHNQPLNQWKHRWYLMWFWHISITSALIKNLPKIYETNTKSADETRLMTTCTCITKLLPFFCLPFGENGCWLPYDNFIRSMDRKCTCTSISIHGKHTSIIHILTNIWSMAMYIST